METRRTVTMLALTAWTLLFGGCPSATDKGAASQGEVAVPFYVCRYENPFTHVDECREYRGKGFDEATATKACAKPFTSVVGKLSKVGCGSKDAIGTCTEAAGTPEQVVTWAYGGFRTIYAGACERFAHGKWSDEANAPVAEPPIKLMDEAKRAMASTPVVTVEPECQDEACLQRLIDARSAIWFRPRATAAQDAIVFYPGAGVDPRAYAPFAQALAAEGVAFAIVPMHSNLALTGIDRAGDVLRGSPSIKRWFVAGHSMGGVMAARFAAHGSERARLAGLILWAAYPSDDDDLSQSALATLTVFGSQDGRTTLAEIDGTRRLLPSSTRYQRLEGANHAQFGWYGVQEEDRPAFLERAQQQDMIVAATLQFVRSATSAPTTDARFAAAVARDRTLCRDAQTTLPNLVALQTAPIDSQEVLDPKAFAVAKARIERGADSRAHAVQRTVARGQATRLDAPAVLAREVWCKLKDQATLSTVFSVDARGPELTCRDLNTATVAWARTLLTPEEQGRAESRRVAIEAAADRAFPTGPEWLTDGRLEITTTAQPHLSISVQSASLIVPADAPVDDAFRGVHYCKLLASEEALLRWLEATAP